MTTKTWFITGTSKGFGRIWAEAALARGDRVAGTARDIGALQPLSDEYGDAFLPIALDVTDREADFAAVAAAKARFGRIDVAINNAGYGHFGTVEETTEAEARAQFETNVFGALWVTQALIPVMREQGSGHILQVSSIGGISAFPMLGIYNASKWALEAFSQSLAAEVAPSGIRVTLIEPGAYGTDWSGASSVRSAPLAQYDAIREARSKSPMVQMDPFATADAILAVVDADEPPLRIFLGKAPFDIMEADYAKRRETWEQWRAVSEAAAGA